MPNENIPSEKELEQLANQFFKSVPGQGNGFSKPDFPLNESVLANIDLPFSTPASPKFTDGSIPGFEDRSRNTYTDDYEKFDVNNPQTSHKDPFFKDSQIPKSVTGDGSSPYQNQIGKKPELPDNQKVPALNEREGSVADFILKTEKNYARDNTVFDLDDPQTSLPDPHFYNGEIPGSFTGSGKMPSINQVETTCFDPYKPNVSQYSGNKLPFEGDNLPDNFNQVFSYTNPLKFSNQLPIPAAGVSPFYFANPTSIFPNISTGIPGLNPSTKNFGSNEIPFDAHLIKKDFPILNEYVNGKKLVWLDNAATTQKPQSVIDRLSYFYQHENSNIHRAAHELAARATDAYEAARNKIKDFLNAGSVNEIIFTRGTTESINLVASSWGRQHLGEGDEIILSNLEHHANIVPWQLLSKKKGFKIRVIPVDDDGQLILEEYASLLNDKTKLVSFTQVSNALGTITQAKAIIDMAHQAGAKVLLDGAQSVSHMKVDLQELNPDFFVLSGHKIFGPTGIGVLYGKEDLLNKMQPYQGGGNMIQDVRFEHTVFHDTPNRFEAGTGNIADAVGLGAAIDYVSKIGIERIGQYEHELLDYATGLLKQIPGIQLIGTAKDKASVLSFTLKGFSNDEVGKILNREGIAVRTGHHCAQPILRRLGHETTVRPSFAFYNTFEDADLLAETVNKIAGKKGYFLVKA